MTTLFAWAFGLVIYTYFGYPLLIWLLAKVRPAARVDDDLQAPSGSWPAVTVVISVYNEAGRIPAKLANLRALDYPKDHMRIVFVNDGSSDATADVLKAQADVRCIHHTIRQGKPQSLNEGVAAAQTPVIALMDVRQTTPPDALKRLVGRLLQTSKNSRAVGAVSGELTHIDPTTQTAASIGLYWRYEKLIRKAESRWDSTVGTTGACYVLRTEDFMPLPPDTLLDDFVIPMHITRRGKRVLLHDGVPVFDELQKEVSGERKRKVRTLSGNFQAFFRYPWLFAPWSNRLVWQFISHKVLRLLVPYALLVLLFSNMVLVWQGAGWFYTAAFIAQIMFYAAALFGPKLAFLQGSKLVSVAGVFVELNGAAVQGLWRYLFASSDSKWEKTS
jgi:poly-beta-1,6-N-acetyl-D-glucosamine synthase